MQISGKCNATDRVETFDLLRDQLIVNSRILRMGERSRAVQELSAYEAIRLAYGDLRAEIDQAAELVRSW